MRDNRLDVVRGFTILLLTVTHTMPGLELQKQFGHFYPFSHIGFHAADIFVAFSGLVCGLVYKRGIHEKGLIWGVQKASVRSIQIFLYNAIAFCCVAVIIVGFNAANILSAVHTFKQPFLGSALGTIFLYDPLPYFDILNVYIIFLLITPFFVAAQLRSKLAIIASGAIYLIYTFFHLKSPSVGSDGPFFVSVFAWQFLFFGGVTIGMNYQKVRAALPPLDRSLGLIFGYVLITFFMRDQAWIIHNFETKFDLGVFRILDLIVFFYVLDRLMSPSTPVTIPFLKTLAALGSNSLFCFSMTLIVVYMGSITLSVFDGARFVYLAVLLLELGAMLVLGNILRNNEKFKRLTQMRWVERIVP
jgi:hypothetical protein